MIWFQGWEKRPKFSQAYTSSWESMHPDFEIIHWDEESFNERFFPILDEELTNSLVNLPTLVQKVDLLRLIILRYMGGIYVDLDFVCLKNIETYLSGTHFVASVEHDGIIANGFIATVPNHPMILAAIEFIKITGLPRAIHWRDDDKYDKRFVLETTGPHAISPVWWFTLANLPSIDKDSIHIETDTTKFFPMKYREYDVTNDQPIVKTLQEIYPESIAVHMYWGSWTYNEHLFKAD